VQDILDRQRTEARQALRPSPTAWQQARPRATAPRPPRPARTSPGEVLQALLAWGAANHASTLFAGAVLAWALTLLLTAWLLGVFP
jgi:hypothetical protein